MGKKSKTFEKSSVTAAINEAGSSVAAIASHLGITPKTARRYLTEYELWGLLATSQELLKTMAAANLVQAVEAGDLETSRFVLERLDKNVWAKRTEIQGSEGSLLLELTPSVRKMLNDKGIDGAKVMRVFEQMLEAQSQQSEMNQMIAGPMTDPPEPQKPE